MASSAAIGEHFAKVPRRLRWLAASGRVVLAAILVLSGTFKAVDPSPSSQFLEALLLRAGIAFSSGWILTIVLVLMELGLATCLVLFWTRRWTVLLTFGFFFGAACLTLWAAQLGLELACGCFGGLISLPPEAAAVRAAGLATGCLALLIVEHTSVSHGAKTEVRPR